MVQPITPEDVIFSFEQFKKVNPFYALLLQERRQGREDRRSRGHLHVRRQRQSRVADDRRRAFGRVEEVLGRQGRQRQTRDLAKSTVELPLGNGAYKIKSVDTGPQNRLRARTQLLGQGSARDARRSTISTPSSSPIIATARRHSRISKPESSTYWIENRASSLGDAV